VEVGLALWIATVVVTFLTGNPNLIPTMVLTGSFLVEQVKRSVGLPGDSARCHLLAGLSPAGEWTDLFAGEVHLGPSVVDRPVPLTEIPAYRRSPLPQ
jgi:hypothetical protein